MYYFITFFTEKESYFQEEQPSSQVERADSRVGWADSREEQADSQEEQPNPQEAQLIPKDQYGVYSTFLKDRPTTEDVHIKASVLTKLNVIITIALIAFHIIADVNYIQYGNEILDNTEYEFRDDWKKSEYLVIPIWHAIISFLQY